jgi:hypothetical protein
MFPRSDNRWRGCGAALLNCNPVVIVTAAHCVDVSSNYMLMIFFYIFGGIFFPYYIQHCFVCRPSDSTVPTDAGIEPRTVATRQSDAQTTRLDLTSLDKGRQTLNQ